MKQAVVLIHGVGEQVPMDTLRDFVKAVWSADAGVRNPWTPATVWSKPDLVSGDLELRRLTTAENKDGTRTDFFEFYWAHLMAGTTLSHLRAWIGVLLFRSPARVPPQLRGVWWMIVGLLAAAAFVATGQATGMLDLPASLLSTLGVVWFLVGGVLVKTLLGVVGDAARYLHVAPPNIEIRHRIRHAGIELLQKLHAPEADYDRIIVVGHSLGSVIGYDILTHLWARHHDAHATKPGPDAPPPTPALDALEALAKATPVNPDQYQAAQAACLDELRAQGCPWRVTDFVTLGSPLAHARYLLERNDGRFDDKIAEREFPTCPPVLEPGKPAARFSFLKNKLRIPHHAAPFAPTRWTNVFFPCRNTFWGDLIGGPVAPVFGSGVKDIAARTTLRRNIFSHTLYWTLPPGAPATPAPSWIDDLRRAVRILR